MVQVTYQKNNGCIFKRQRNTTLPYKIGDTTSMGWKVLNIEYEYNNKFYPEYKYYMLIQNEKKTSIKKKQILEIITREFKTFIYYFIALILLNLLKMLIGI